jgi:hypothetical protein
MVGKGKGEKDIGSFAGRYNLLLLGIKDIGIFAGEG